MCTSPWQARGLFSRSPQASHPPPDPVHAMLPVAPLPFLGRAAPQLVGSIVPPGTHHLQAQLPSTHCRLQGSLHVPKTHFKAFQDELLCSRTCPDAVQADLQDGHLPACLPLCTGTVPATDRPRLSMSLQLIPCSSLIAHNRIELGKKWPIELGRKWPIKVSSAS